MINMNDKVVIYHGSENIIEKLQNVGAKIEYEEI